jgi:hypothetical protein
MLTHGSGRTTQGFTQINAVFMSRVSCAVSPLNY